MSLLSILISEDEIEKDIADNRDKILERLYKIDDNERWSGKHRKNIDADAIKQEIKHLESVNESLEHDLADVRTSMARYLLKLLEK